jgi:hypothetical protein
VRRGIASSAHIHGDLHTQLSTDPEFEVRLTLARNPSRQSGARLEGWHNLIAAGHAAEVAANPACPESVKVELVCHGTQRERHLAWAGIRFHELDDWKGILDAVEGVLTDPERVTELVQIARNQTIGGTLKGRLIAHEDLRVTRAVATQGHLTEEQRIRQTPAPPPMLRRMIARLPSVNLKSMNGRPVISWTHCSSSSSCLLA